MGMSSYNYYYSIFSSYPFSYPIYVNNILEREKQEETPIKWGKKEIENFPLRIFVFFLKGKYIFP